MALKVFNTLKRKKEEFVPLNPPKVGLYTCGPTVYNYPHIGNYRAYVFGDLLKRYLKYKGFDVTHVMNITDVDDKTIRDSQKQKVSLKEFTQKYENAFFEDLETLNILPANVFSRATEHIKEMIALVQKLIDKGYAYKSDDGIYYSIRKFKNYGKFAHIKLGELEAGASGRVKADEYAKENAHDFALWKFYTPEDGDVFWEAPFGKGRPGWHIECSAMSMKYLGEQFDIHTGGIDLIFPHHQNEIAQSEGATGKQFVKYWLHNEWLLVDGKRMGKSLGNFYSLRDVLDKGHDPLAIRYLYLGTHYRQQFNFTFAGLDAAKQSLNRIWDCYDKLLDVSAPKHNPEVHKRIEQLKKEFTDAMDNDLDTPPALAALFEFVKDINVMIANNSLSAEDGNALRAAFEDVDKVLGILKKKEKPLPKELQKLINERERAREAKDWKKSDEIRDKLREKGIILEDSPQGVRWKRA
ncbi:MAG: cysteine--tRNA ligase [Candidatus Woesearchaeota archaeon]